MVVSVSGVWSVCENVGECDKCCSRELKEMQWRSIFFNSTQISLWNYQMYKEITLIMINVYQTHHLFFSSPLDSIKPVFFPDRWQLFGEKLLNSSENLKKEDSFFIILLVRTIPHLIWLLAE